MNATIKIAAARANMEVDALDKKKGESAGSFNFSAGSSF